MKLTEKQLKEIVSKYPKQKNGMIRAEDVPHLFDPEYCHGLYEVEEIESMEYNQHLTEEEIKESVYPQDHPLYAQLQKAAIKTKKLREQEEMRKAISIRLQNKTIRLLKQQAKEQGLPYQTMISSLLHQIAHKKIKLTIS